MDLYPTCSHIKEDGSFCRVAALHDQRFCYYHLSQRGRRLRQARALRDHAPYPLEIQSLDNPYAVRNAITEIVQAIGAGQLDPLAAGKMLYGIQLVRAENNRIARMEADAAKDAAQNVNDPVPQASDPVPQACPEPAERVRARSLRDNLGPDADTPRVQQLPNFNKQFGLAPAADLDAEIDATFQQAAKAATDQQPLPMPAPPPGIRVGSPAWRVYREDCYQALQAEVQDLRFKLRDYFEVKRQESLRQAEELYQEAGIPLPKSFKKSSAPAPAAPTKPEANQTA